MKVWTVNFYNVTVSGETKEQAIEKARAAIAADKVEVCYANEHEVME